MDRVRRVVTEGALNFTTITSNVLVVSAEKKATLVFDSMTPMEEEISESDLKMLENKEDHVNKADKPIFFWKQTEDDLEFWYYGGESISKSMLKIDLTDGRLEVRIGSETVIKGTLLAPVEQETLSWTLENGKICLTVWKESKESWSSIWKTESEDYTKGEEITDLSDDCFMENFTTENPLVSDKENGYGTTFNSEQLEECDNCESEDMIQWIGGVEEMTANLSGHQYLCRVMQSRSAATLLCTRHDVDGLVWQMSDEGLNHHATFPALGYIQASKTQRKFVTAPPSFNYSVICDNRKHIYLYRQPESLAAETELRNRKSGQRIEKVARQQVITLDSSDEIMGLVAMELSLYVLTKTCLYTVQI